MVVTSQEPACENQTDRYPLLMEERGNHVNHEHVIDVVRGSGYASSSGSSGENSPCDSHLQLDEQRPSSSSNQVPLSRSSSSSSSGSNARDSSGARSNEFVHQRWSPFRCSLWFLVEFLFTMGQIVASIVVLSISTHEKPQAPLFAWVVGYAVGCAASLPLLYWRCLRRNQGIEQSSNQSRQGTSQGNSVLERNPYITISLTRSSVDGDRQNTSTAASNEQHTGASNIRVNVLMDHFKMALDCFFAVWFVVGNVWIFGGHASSSEAPNLYRLCIVFLTISCIGYAMPFILCAIICCCLPCIISILGRENMNQMRGATAESINALPAYKFKIKSLCSGSSREDNLCSEGGVLAAGTEKERAVSEEDAVCCICLAKYVDDDELRELPCSHFFHTECVDKWLRISATCPLCKFEVGENNGTLPSGETDPQA